MVGDTLRDLLAAQAAGCEPHLVLSGRAAALDDEQLQRMLAQVPGGAVHPTWRLCRPPAAARPRRDSASGAGMR
jgi:hypothetical protein